MTWYTYPILPAIDPNTGLPIYNAGGQVFDPDDTAFATPLPVFDVAGISLAGNVVVVTGDATTSQFRVEDQPVVNWKSGDHVITLSSPQGMLDASTAAAASAADALAQLQTISDTLDAAPQILPDGGSVGDVLYNAGSHLGSWGPPPQGTGGTGGAADWNQLVNRPATFPPSPHTHPATEVSDATTVGRSVMTAATAQAARQAIGAGTGNGSSDLQLGSTGTTAAAGNHTHAASGIAFTPASGITATNVQDAIAQAALSGGGSGAAAVLVWRYTAGAWPTLPSSQPAGVQEVRALGPSYPTSIPGWVGLAAGKVPLSYSKVAVA